MPENRENTGNKRNLQVLFGFLYVTLFLFLFVVKPAPEQKLRATIGISATEAEIASLLKAGYPMGGLLAVPEPASANPGDLEKLAKAADEWAALMLTKTEGTDIALEPQSSHVVVTVEMHWEVRGGLLGKAVDQMIGRPARVHHLATTLRRLKAQAEEQHMRRAGRSGLLPPTS